MDNIVSRFLTFEETLGRGLVKFAYFVILIGLVVWAVVEIIGGVILLFDRPLAGLWEIVHTPFEFALWAILLRVATELILAILSIDDNLAETALGDRQGAVAPGAAPQVSASPTPTMTASSDAARSGGTTSASAAASSSSGATDARAATAKSTKRTTKTAAKKTTKKAAKSTGSTQATAQAAAASPASARSTGGAAGGAKSDDTPRGGDGEDKSA